MNNIDVYIEEADKLILQYRLEDIKSDSLFYGKAGIAFYCLFMYELTNDDKYLSKIAEVLDYLFLEETTKNSILYSQNSFAEGLAGLGYLLLKLKENNIVDESFDQVLDGMSEIVQENCLIMIEKSQFDFFYGSFGLLYFLFSNKKYDQCEILIKKIYEISEKNNFYLFNITNDVYTQGYNFGFAHGVVGFISILVKCVDYLIDKDLIKYFIYRLVVAVSEFNKSVFIPEKCRFTDKRYTYPSFYPYNVYIENYTSETILSADILKKGISHYTNRIGWCNSDIGHALIYNKVGILLGNDNLILNSRLIGNTLVKRLCFEETGIDSMYMCHGSSGVTQIYKRMYQLTSNEEYYKSFLYWLKITENYLIKEVELLDIRPGLLSGWLIPILMLKEFYGKSDLKWDSVFLIS